MAKFRLRPTVDSVSVITARLGAGTGAGNNLKDTERNKFVKLAGTDRYNLAGVGDEIEGYIASINTATQDGYTIGGVAIEFEYQDVTFDGLQATPGVGAIAVGDYVLVGTPVPKDTPLGLTPPRVVKATDQAAAKSSPFACRVESLGTAGTGAVGTVGAIRQVC